MTVKLKVVMMVFACCSYQSQAEDLNALKVKEYRLENGLTVWLNEDHSQPKVFGAVVVKAGAKDCPDTSFSDLFSQFSRITDGVAMVFVRGFYIFCWTCLFFVPGFIKTYSYAMTPYVLMEHPEYSANEAITESRRLMDGKKWNLFCLTFSFIGWRLICSIQYIIPAVLLYTQGRLSGVTVLFLVGLMGPLNIGYLFLRPYEEAAFAAFYRDVRDEKREIEEIEMRDKWSENEPEKSENA